MLREFITYRLKIQSMLKKIILKEQVPYRNTNLFEGMSVGMINTRLNIKYAFVLKINWIPSKLKQLVISKHLFKKWNKQATNWGKYSKYFYLPQELYIGSTKTYYNSVTTVKEPNF